MGTLSCIYPALMETRELSSWSYSWLSFKKPRPRWSRAPKQQRLELGSWTCLGRRSWPRISVHETHIFIPPAPVSWLPVTGPTSGPFPWVKALFAFLLQLFPEIWPMFTSMSLSLLPSTPALVSPSWRCDLYIIPSPLPAASLLYLPPGEG